MPKTARRRVLPEDFYLFKTVGDPQISPDGKQVAYVVVGRTERPTRRGRPCTWPRSTDDRLPGLPRQQGPQSSLVAGRPLLAFVSRGATEYYSSRR
jgi:hypothetical protein